MRTQCEFEPASHAGPTDCGDYGLGRFFECGNKCGKARLAGGGGSAEFLHMRASGKDLRCTGDHDGADMIVGECALECRHQASAQFRTNAVDGRVVQRDHRDTTADVEMRRHTLSSCTAFGRSSINPLRSAMQTF